MRPPLPSFFRSAARSFSRRARQALLLLASALAFLPTAQASSGTEVPADDTPTAKVTRILVRKGAHEMALYAGETKVMTYAVAIGPGGKGPKHIEGDKVTPVGRYHVIAKSPSVWGIFMRLDYPNAEDRVRFAKLKREGALPRNATIGGDIGIHGAPQEREYKKTHKQSDWTLGCIALDDEEIRELARRVAVGTIVDIED